MAQRIGLHYDVSVPDIMEYACELIGSDAVTSLKHTTYNLSARQDKLQDKLLRFAQKERAIRRRQRKALANARSCST